MKVLLALLVLGSFVTANADVAGVWSGSIEYYQNGAFAEQADAQIEISSDGTTLNVSESYFGDAYAFSIQGTELHMDGVKVGDMSDATVSAVFAYPNDPSCEATLRFDLTSTSEAQYSNSLNCAADGYSDEMKGTLNK